MHRLVGRGSTLRCIERAGRRTERERISASKLVHIARVRAQQREMGAAGEEGAKREEEKDDIDHSERAQHETRVHPGAVHTCGRGKRAGATRPCAWHTHTGEHLGPSTY